VSNEKKATAAGRSYDSRKFNQLRARGTSPRMCIARIASGGGRPPNSENKGFGALGTCVGSPEAAEYSRHCYCFRDRRSRLSARFSPGGGDPEASDTEKSPRGLGLQVRLPGAQSAQHQMIPRRGSSNDAEELSR